MSSADYAATLNAGTFLPASLWRGFGRKSLDDVLELAADMEKQGASPYEIFKETGRYSDPKETGFWRNPAKQWIWELSDEDMGLQPWLSNVFQNALTGEAGGSTGLIKLDRALKADDLFDRAPALRDVKVQLEQLEPGSTTRHGGYYADPTTSEGKGTSTGLIDVKGKVGTDPFARDDPMGVLPILAHEGQHAAQWRYHMPQGSNADDAGMSAMYLREKKYGGGMRDYATGLRRDLEKHREKFAADNAATAGGVDEARALWERTYPDENDMLKSALYTGGGPADKKAGLPAVPPLSYRLHDMYESVYGEDQARRTAERLGMTGEQRKLEPGFLADPKKGHLPPNFNMLRFGNRWGMPAEALDRDALGHILWKERFTP